jgi:hypothetical protein
MLKESDVAARAPGIDFKSTATAPIAGGAAL